MKQFTKWAMQIDNYQLDEDGEESCISLNTLVDLRVLPSGCYLIRYDEPESSGMDNTRTEIFITPEQVVTICRSGSYDSDLVLQTGKRHHTVYETPFGSFTLEVETEYARVDLGADGGTISLRYKVVGVNMLITDSRIEMRIYPVKRSDEEDTDD